MGAAASCILAAVVVLILLIVAAAAVSAWRKDHPAKKTDTYMPGDPAAPSLRDVVSYVKNDLSCISQVADETAVHVAQIETGYGSVDMGPTLNEARLKLIEAKKGAENITAGIRGLQQTLATSAPTYQNALGLYAGLRAGDAALAAAAAALDGAGAAMQSLISASSGHADIGQPHIAALRDSLAAAAARLRQMGACLGSLVRSVHVLGAALQLE